MFFRRGFRLLHLLFSCQFFCTLYTCASKNIEHDTPINIKMGGALFKQPRGRDALYLEVEIMLRRKAKLQNLGAFVDTKGSRSKGKRPRRRGLSSRKREEDDEVEEKLESLVFGRAPFQPSPAVQEADLSEEVRA